MALYSVTNLNATTPTRQNITTTVKSQIHITATTGASTLGENRWYDILVGVDSVPADNATNWDVSRFTAAGTGVSGNVIPLSPSTRGAGATATINCTANPTTTANSSVWALAMNQRASFRWVAAPGSELVGPATNANGLTLGAFSGAYAGVVNCAVLFSE